jgi:sigma-E factor negative regulatory protein RseA
MTEKLNEKISALMDGDLAGRDAHDVIQDLKQSAESRQRWERYHLIGDALRNNLPPVVRHDLASRIAAAIDAETSQSLPSVVPFVPRQKNKPAPFFLKPLAGLAIAASVAAVAVVSFDMGGNVTPAAQTMAAAPAQMQSANRLPVSVVPLVVDEVAAQTRLNDYLVNHSQYSTVMQGEMLPSARIVGYNPNE